MKSKLTPWTFLIPQPSDRFYTKQDEANDMEAYGVDISDAVHAIITSLALNPNAGWEEKAEGVIEQAIDAAASIATPPTDDPESDASADYWNQLHDNVKSRIHDLMLIAETFLLPYLPAIRKHGQLIAVEAFKNHRRHTYEVSAVMEDQPTPDTPPDAPKSLKQEDWLSWVLTKTDGQHRSSMLGITPTHYSSLELANLWFDKNSMLLNHGRDEYREPYNRLCEIYHRMTQRSLTDDQVALIGTTTYGNPRDEWELLGTTRDIYTNREALEKWYEHLVKRCQPVGKLNAEDTAKLDHLRDYLYQRYQSALDKIASNTMPPNLSAATPVDSLEACFLTDQIKSLSDIEAISFNSMATGHAMESVGYRWDELQSPHLTKAKLLDKPLYLTDDPVKWSSPWLRGDKALRLTRVKYRITNPLVEIDHPTPYEFLHSADTLPHMRQRHDSIVHVHDRTQDRQMVLLNPKAQVLDVDTVPDGLVAKYLSDIVRRVDETEASGCTDTHIGEL